MSGHGAYGEDFGRRFRLESAPTIVSRVLKKNEIGVTEIRSDNPELGMNDPIPKEDAYLVGLQLRDYPDHQFWEDGRAAPKSSLRAGQSVLYDLKRGPAFLMDKPFHSMHFYLSRSTFEAIAEDAEALPIGELDYKPGQGIDDKILENLGRSLRAAFDQADHVSRLFVDHVTLAVALHVATTYGGLRPASRQARGGLAPWQVNNAKEMIDANLHDRLAIKAVAAECGLSASHFSRAFRQSVGMPPHRWLMERRVARAKEQLLDERLPLAEIATACGFADQSHFSRAFSRQVGVGPAAWRRNMKR